MTELYTLHIYKYRQIHIYTDNNTETNTDTQT